MTLSIKALALLITGLVPAYGERDESAESRADRMHVVAEGIVWATESLTCSGRHKPADDRECKRWWAGSDHDLALGLVTQAWHESKFEQRIQLGNCTDVECDAEIVRARGKRRVFHHARGFWQVQRTTDMARRWWPYILGGKAENYRAGALVAGYSLARNRCGGNLEQMFQAQDGKGCRDGGRGNERASWMRARLGEYWRIVKELKRDEDPPEMPVAAL